MTVPRPARSEPRNQPLWERLFDRRIELPEQVGELQADAIDDGDDGERDGGCNQSVLDRSSSRLVTKKLRQKTLHLLPQCPEHASPCRKTAVQNLRSDEFEHCNLRDKTIPGRGRTTLDCTPRGTIQLTVEMPSL